MHRQGIVLNEFAVEIPHGIQQLPAGEYPPLAGGQAVENMELRGREGQDFPPAGNRPPGAVQDKFPDLQPLGRGGVRPAQEDAGCGTRSSLSRKGLAT